MKYVLSTKFRLNEEFKEHLMGGAFSTFRRDYEYVKKYLCKFLKGHNHLQYLGVYIEKNNKNDLKEKYCEYVD
jgi:hypothetical protein